MTLDGQLEGGTHHSRIVAGLFLLSAGTLLALTLWRVLKDGRLDDDASQLCRLVSPRRSKDDDKRVQLKRRRGSRLRTHKSMSSCSNSDIFKRQNTI